MTTKEKIDNLSEDLKEIYEFIKSNAPKQVNATQVGIVVGRKTSSKASAWAHYRLKQLIEEGLVEKDEETKKYSLASDKKDEKPAEPAKAEKKDSKKSEKKAEKKDEKSDEDSDEIPEHMQNTEDELQAGITLVEFKPHHLSAEAKEGMETVKGLVTKVFTEDDGRRFAQVKMEHNGKRCFKRDRFLTVIGEAEVEEEKE